MKTSVRLRTAAMGFLALNPQVESRPNRVSPRSTRITSARAIGSDASWTGEGPSSAASTAHSLGS